MRLARIRSRWGGKRAVGGVVEVLVSTWGRFFKSHPGFGMRLARIRSRLGGERAGSRMSSGSPGLNLGKVFQISPWAWDKGSRDKWVK